MIKYNLDKIIKIEVSDFKPSTWYKYRLGIKIFGITIRFEGVHSHDGYWHGFCAPEDHTLKDEVVYENPSVTLHFEDDSWEEYHFKSLSEAEHMARSITEKGNWIEIR